MTSDVTESSSNSWCSITTRRLRWRVQSDTSSLYRGQWEWCKVRKSVRHFLTVTWTVCIISVWVLAYRSLLKELLHIDTLCELGKDVATVITVSLVHCGAGLTWWLVSCGLNVHVVNRSIVGSAIKVNGSGSLREVAQFYNRSYSILKTKKILRHISLTKQNTQLRSYLISAFHI